MFEGLGLECFAKTSGSKGMQVYLPLNSEATFAQTKAFAKAVAELLAREEPELVVARQTKSARAGKVLVDWGQNDVNKTTVNVYSLRAMARPTVSTPVTWDEVARGAGARGPDLRGAPTSCAASTSTATSSRRCSRLSSACRGVACVHGPAAQAASPRFAISPEERHAECAERCLEVLCDPERASAARLGEHEEAAIEADRRRWEPRRRRCRASSVVADQRDEAHLLQQLALQARGRAPGERQPLQRLGDRGDEPPAGRELGLELGQRPRRCPRPRR